MIGFTVLAAGVAVGLVMLAMYGPVVQRLEGPALRDADGRPRLVTALRWDEPGRLSIGTAGAGIVTWTAATGELAPDPVSLRAGRTILSLPPLPAGVDFAERPAITLRTRAPAIGQSLGSDGKSLSLAQAELESEARLPVLTFRKDGADPAPEHGVAERLAIGKDVIVTQLSTSDLRFISIHGEQRSTDNATESGSVPGFPAEFATAIIAAPDGSAAVLGDKYGRMYLSELARGPAVVAQPLEKLEFTLSSVDKPDMRQEITAQEISQFSHAVTSLAVSADGKQVAAAADDGRIVILRPDPNASGTAQAPPPLVAQEVGLAPPELWIEPVEFPAAASAAPNYTPLGFSSDGASLMLADYPGGRIVQTEVGGKNAVLAGDPSRDQAQQTSPPQPLAPLAPLLSNMRNMGVNVGPSSPFIPLGDLPWQLPLRLPYESTIWAGSAVDPETQRAVVWGEGGEVHVVSPGDEKLGENLGNGQPVAAAAFEPLTGALVVLQPDGTARRLPADPSPASQLRFAPPQSPSDAPPADARALSFPPDEMTTLVLWSRTATSPAILRRYDRTTAEPLDEGLDVGFDVPVLPDHAALVMSVQNGRELLVRDARSGSPVLHAVFGGGSLALSPTPYGRELGTFTRDGKMWTLRLAPRSGGTPAAPSSPPDVTQSTESVAAPVSGGVAPDGLSLSSDGNTLLVRGRQGQIYAARPAAMEVRRTTVAPCCIRLRALLPGTVATRAVLSPDGAMAVVAGADASLWSVDLESGAAQPLLQMSGPVRAMALSPDGASLAAVADGSVPVVLHLGRAAWVAGLPLVGHRPYVVPPAMGPRYLPQAGLPPGAEPDTILLAVLRSMDSARALRDTARAAGLPARAVMAGSLVLVTMPLENARPVQARGQLARARALAPETRGAILHRFELLCPGIDQAGDTPDVAPCGAPPNRASKS